MECPYRIPGSAFRYFNARETTGVKPTSRDVTTMLSLGRSRAIESGSQLQARIDALARYEQTMAELGRRPPEEHEQHSQQVGEHVRTMERWFKNAVQVQTLEDRTGYGGARALLSAINDTSDGRCSFCGCLDSTQATSDCRCDEWDSLFCGCDSCLTCTGKRPFSPGSARWYPSWCSQAEGVAEDTVETPATEITGAATTGIDAGVDPTSGTHEFPSAEGSQEDMATDLPQPLTTADQAPVGYGPGLPCGLENGQCFDGNLRIYTFDPPQDHLRATSPPDGREWQVGNKLEPDNIPLTKLSKLLIGDVVLTCHRDGRGMWIAERAVVEQVLCYRCQFDECRMTSIQGFRGDAAITSNHRVMLRQGLAPVCWENAEVARGARTRQRAQQYVYNVRIGSLHGIVAEGGAILATLHTPEA